MFNHPRDGLVSFTQHTFAPAERPDYKLVDARAGRPLSGERIGAPTALASLRKLNAPAKFRIGAKVDDPADQPL